MNKQFGEDKIIILLGAGASCDAGMRNSIQMISDIETLLKGDWEKFKDLYNYIQSSHYHLYSSAYWKYIDSKAFKVVFRFAHKPPSSPVPLQRIPLGSGLNLEN